MFNELAVPAYRKIQENEGTVTGFHTCGVFIPVIESLLTVFSGIKTLDISGWNDLAEVHKRVKKDIALSYNFINSFVIAGKAEEHRTMYEKIGKVIAKGRKVSLNAQAIEKLTGTIDDSIIAMNRFIDNAREFLSAI
jgi:hypothetical protein